jgi:uncharacterized protein (TIGR03435 family)
MIRVVASVVLCAAAFGQAPRPAFEVASVRPSGPPGQGPQIRGLLQGGPGTNDPDRITYMGATQQMLIRQAYGVDFDQIQGPGWLSDARFDIAAKLPPGSTKDQLKLMLQDLLAERFKLTLHHVSKDFPVYELTIAKSGLKIKENTETLEPARPGDYPRGVFDRDGFPEIPPGKSGATGTMVNGLQRLNARGLPLSSLLSNVGAQLGTMTGTNTYSPGRMIDKTGLTGKYDFKLEYAGGGALAPLAAGPDAEPTGGLPLIDAIEKQLGLKLTKTTAPYDVLVIDHAERVPTEN